VFVVLVKVGKGRKRHRNRIRAEKGKEAARQNV
jgi:hypothetical protein